MPESWLISNESNFQYNWRCYFSMRVGFPNVDFPNVNFLNANPLKTSMPRLTHFFFDNHNGLNFIYSKMVNELVIWYAPFLFDWRFFELHRSRHFWWNVFSQKLPHMFFSWLLIVISSLSPWNKRSDKWNSEKQIAQSGKVQSWTPL